MLSFWILNFGLLKGPRQSLTDRSYSAQDQSVVGCLDIEEAYLSLASSLCQLIKRMYKFGAGLLARCLTLLVL